jgi:hypothetical protein
LSKRVSHVHPKALGLVISLTVYLVIAAIYFTTPTQVQLFVYANGFSVTLVYALLDLLGLLEAREDELDS